MKTPYVYKVINKVSGEFYYGSRVCKDCDTEEDFYIYATSNSVVGNMIKDSPHLWEKHIEFTGNRDDVLYTELHLIKKHLHHPLSLNRVTFNHYRNSFVNEINETEFYEMFEKLGFRLKMARIKRRIGQKSISKILGISRATLQRIELGCERVAIGTYIKYLTYLGFGDEFNKFAMDDSIGDKIHAYDLMKQRGSNL
jgi:DNA-binding XRE family transcriptional regulator